MKAYVSVSTISKLYGIPSKEVKEKLRNTVIDGEIARNKTFEKSGKLIAYVEYALSYVVKVFEEA